MVGKLGRFPVGVSQENLCLFVLSVERRLTLSHLGAQILGYWYRLVKSHVHRAKNIDNVI